MIALAQLISDVEAKNVNATLRRRRNQRPAHGDRSPDSLADARVGRSAGHIWIDDVDRK
jgi:hypothetical protein